MFLLFSASSRPSNFRREKLASHNWSFSLLLSWLVERRLLNVALWVGLEVLLDETRFLLGEKLLGAGCLHGHVLVDSAVGSWFLWDRVYQGCKGAKVVYTRTASAATWSQEGLEIRCVEYRCSWPLLKLNFFGFQDVDFHPLQEDFIVELNDVFLPWLFRLWIQGYIDIDPRNTSRFHNIELKMSSFGYSLLINLFVSIDDIIKLHFWRTSWVIPPVQMALISETCPDWVWMYLADPVYDTHDQLVQMPPD